MKILVQITLIGLVATFSLSVSAQWSTKKPSFHKIDEDEDDQKEAKDSSATSAKANEPKEKSADEIWSEYGGQNYSGTPRLIRQTAMTEVFFRDLNQSYVIHDDSKFNATYKAFEQAAQANRPISFRADPYSRRILAVDGVDGARAPTPPATAVAPAVGPSSGSPKKNSK